MNRSTIALIAASLTFASCESGPAKRAITLSVEGAGGKTVYFDRFENNMPYHVDSVKLDAEGRGVLKTIGLPLDFYRIGLDNEQLIVALDSAEELTIEAKVGSLAYRCPVEVLQRRTRLRRPTRSTARQDQCDTG
jgi:hypothetical protein